MNNAIASGLENSPHLKVFQNMVAARFAAIDLTVLLIYMIDTVDVDALPILAEQFDLLGVKGWSFAATEKQQRDMLKRAIELHTIKGTIAGIKTALSLIGYTNSEVAEHVGLYYDNTYVHDGTINYGSGEWYNFMVTGVPSAGISVNAELLTKTIAIINEFKNLRSRLISFNLAMQEAESSLFSESIALQITSGSVESTITF